MRSKLTAVFILSVIACSKCFSQSVDLSKAVVWVGDTKTISLAKPLQVLKEEVEKRTHINFTVSEKTPDKKETAIYLLVNEKESKLPKEVQSALNALAEPGKDGFRLLVTNEPSSVIIMGKDARSVLYGIG